MISEYDLIIHSLCSCTRCSRVPSALRIARTPRIVVNTTPHASVVKPQPSTPVVECRLRIGTVDMPTTAQAA
eukprot:COSAG04_NODE_4090_length_2308_cov_1.460842_2_plen_72_part_00